jgi:hypothetical protein
VVDAILKRDVEAFVAWVGEKSDCGKPVWLGYTPLMIMVTSDTSAPNSVAEVADAREGTEGREVPWHPSAAAQSRDENFGGTLTACTMQVDALGPSGLSALHLAARNRQLGTALCLIDVGADANAARPDGSNLVMFAPPSWFGQLVGRGADISRVDHRGRRLLLCHGWTWRGRTFDRSKAGSLARCLRWSGPERTARSTCDQRLASKVGT